MEYLRKQNYVAAKEDLKEIYTLLQSNGIEVRIAIPEKEAPILTKEELPEPTEKAAPALEKDAVKYQTEKTTPAGGKVIEETEELPTEVEEMMGEEFEKIDPATGLPKKWKKKV